MPKYIGIDAGSFGTPSWVAILDGENAVLDAMQFSLQDQSPLAIYLDDPDVQAVAMDAPQGLPEGQKRCRVCDQAANTPTRRLPATRAEMAAGCCADGTKIPYRGVLYLAVELFFAHHDQLLGNPNCPAPRLMETYPRAVYHCLTGTASPPKRRTPLKYAVAAYRALRECGISCPGLRTPSTDQADALLCALAAKLFLEDKAVCVGKEPWLDVHENVLREGFIALPDRELMRK